MLLAAADRRSSIGGMTIPLGEVKQAKIPLKPVSAASVLAPGMNAEINLPASVLRHYDVSDRLSWAQVLDWDAGMRSIFRDHRRKVLVNAENGLDPGSEQDSRTRNTISRSMSARA